MKVLAALFFILLTPLVIFFTAAIFGGISSTTIKQELVKANIYESIVTTAHDALTESDEENSSYLEIVDEYLTPSYLQEKTETVLDDTGSWVTGRTQSAPELSFKEIKDSITEKNPELLTELEAMSEEMENQPMSEGMTEEEMQANRESAKLLSSITKNDFTFPLENTLKGIKNTYVALKILLPVSALLLILSLVVLFIQSPTRPQKLKWIGGTLMVTAVLGFVLIALQMVFLRTLILLTQTIDNELFQIFSPIVIEILKVFVSTYTNYQGVLSVLLLIVSALCFLFASLSNKKPAPKPVKVTKK